MTEPRRIALAGTFDVANYGDLLFPLVARERLAGCEIVPVSPTNNRPPYDDAVQPVATRALFDPALAIDGIVVGGGYILIARAMNALPTYAAAGVGAEAYPGLWGGTVLAAAVRDVPLVWNAPGAPAPYPQWRRDELIQPALAVADYLSVRDQATLRALDLPGFDIAIVPDTVLGLDRVWSASILHSDHAALMARKGLAADTRCLAVHVRGRLIGDPQAAAGVIDGLAARHGLTPLLVVIGPELDDIAGARRLSQHLKTRHAILDDALSLREIAASIAGAALYVGASMHGYVTAAVYGVPGVLLAMPNYGKFAGLLQHLERPGDLTRDWLSAVSRAEALLAAGERPVIPPAVHAALDRHWARIAEALARPEAGRARRETFLRSYLRYGVRRFGAEWLMQPGIIRPPLATAAE